MERLLKLIWDFRGPDAEKTAKHHEIHLGEYLKQQQLSLNISGVEKLHEMHHLAYIVVTDSEMKNVRDALKPHRGTLYEPT